MALRVLPAQNTVHLIHAQRQMVPAVHVQLDIMVVDVVMCVLLIVMEHPVIKVVVSVTVIVSVDSISLSAQTDVQITVWTVVIELMQLVIPASADCLE